jgi:uncharacterized protein (TIGR00251 family)|tara:strand:+ start:364 stop:576 length:213 start_codon:yes stop_codon:yes gene_type:complete
MKFQIKVQPNSSKQQIQTDIDGKIQKVYLKKPAKDNKANIELEKLLAKHFKAKAKIIKGHTSKNKTVEIV